MRYLTLEQSNPDVYKSLGLISGLEIHQQLLTDRKLFCRCPAGRYSKRWDAEILRHMRPTLSELGEYDGTALMEFKTKKEITYLINKGTVCTYEFDDTPPFQVDEEALDIAIEVTLLLNCSQVSELHIARKQYLDGSIPAGFQRTTILGVDGWLPYKGRRIRVRQLALEEDSCREVGDSGHKRTYITDRLGMPLIETVTEPDMKTPEDVAGVAQRLRDLVRATGKVRTGAGAAREDVNVSVRGGDRCEIKGVPSIRRIPLLVHNEAFRQSALLDLRDELAKRGVDPKSFRSEEKDVTSRFKGTRYGPIARAIEEGHRVWGTVLRGCGALMGHPLGAGRSFLHELSDRVRVIACLDSEPNILTSDLPDDNLRADRWKKVRKALGAGSGDAAVLVWGPESDAETGAKEVSIRVREACLGVPQETRQALSDGTTGFERILPGPDRMYPDTDLPPKAVTDGRVRSIRGKLPEPPWQREDRYIGQGIPEQLARDMGRSRFAPFFDKLAERETGPRTFAAWLLTQHLRALRRKGLDLAGLDESFLGRILALLASGSLMRRGVLKLIELSLKGVRGDPEGLMGQYGLIPAGEREVEGIIRRVVRESKELEFPSRDDLIRYAMGKIMYSVGLRVDGRKVSELLEKAVDEADFAVPNRV